jgi:hypothetical protein
MFFLFFCIASVFFFFAPEHLQSISFMMRHQKAFLRRWRTTRHNSYKKIIMWIRTNNMLLNQRHSTEWVGIINAAANVDIKRAILFNCSCIRDIDIHVYIRLTALRKRIGWEYLRIRINAVRNKIAIYCVRVIDKKNLDLLFFAISCWYGFMTYINHYDTCLNRLKLNEN